VNALKKPSGRLSERNGFSINGERVSKTNHGRRRSGRVVLTLTSLIRGTAWPNALVSPPMPVAGSIPFEPDIYIPSVKA